MPPRSFSASSMMPIARSVPAIDEAAVARTRCRPAEASSTCEAICLPCSITLAAASTIAVPLCIIEREPPVPPPASSSSLSPCSSRMRSNGTPSCLAQHLRERRGVALAVVERAGEDRHAAVGLEADAAHLLVGGAVTSR